MARVKKSKEDVIRVGDRVKVVNPRWIKRIGYPLIWTDLTEEVETDPRTMEALKVMGFKVNFHKGPPPDFVKTVAMMRVHQRGFGGPDRTIHYHPIAADDATFMDSIDMVPHHGYVGRTVLVLGKQLAKTGVRLSGYGDYEDYTPPELTEVKTHIILKTIYGNIEDKDVEKVKDVSRET